MHISVYIIYYNKKCDVVMTTWNMTSNFLKVVKFTAYGTC